MATQIKLRRDTAANWTSNSTVVLAAGEPGFETDTGQLKIGNGTSTWAQLSYIQGAGGSSAIDRLTSPDGDQVVVLDNTGTLTLPDNVAQIITPSAGSGNKDIDIFTNNWSSGGVEVYLQHDDRVSIITANGAHEWSFANDATLSLPECGAVGAAVIQPNDTTFGIKLISNSNTWAYGTDGSLTFPNGTLFGSNEDNSSAILNADTDKNFTINTFANSQYHSWIFGTDGNLTIPEGITSITDLTLRAPSDIPGDVANWQGGGGWNQGYYSAISTTGGTGTGLTVNVAAGGGGYINISAISIANPGSGYTDGDVITINNENNIPGTFTISVIKPAWVFGTSGSLTLPQGVVQRDTGNVTCSANADTVIFTSYNDVMSTIKLLIKVEGTETNGQNWDSQSCEMIVAKSWRANTVVASIYAVVHTSVNPLATFTAQWNATTSRVEVLCRPTSSTYGVEVKTFATEILTSD